MSYKQGFFEQISKMSKSGTASFGWCSFFTILLLTMKLGDTKIYINEKLS